VQDQPEPQLKNLVNDDEQCLIVGRWIRQRLLQFQQFIKLQITL